MEPTDVRPPGSSPDPPPPASPASRWRRWALAGLLVLAVAGFYALGLHRYFSWEFVRGHLDTWQAQVRDNLPLALAVFFVTYVAVTALSLPVAAILTLVAGALFGRWLATGMVSVAATLGATLALLSSRYVLRDWVRWRFGDRLAAIDRGVEKDGTYYLFALRLVPAVPFFLINLGMGLTRMRVGTFAAVSWLGMLPGTFLYVNAGTELAAAESPADLLSWKVLLSLALLGIVPLALRKLIKWRWRTAGIAAGGLLLIAGPGVDANSMTPGPPDWTAGDGPRQVARDPPARPPWSLT
jgi:uncharacterized membrane protein YdjX (TVP38/TMEM64 family)